MRENQKRGNTTPHASGPYMRGSANNSTTSSHYTRTDDQFQPPPPLVPSKRREDDDDGYDDDNVIADGSDDDDAVQPNTNGQDPGDDDDTGEFLDNDDDAAATEEIGEEVFEVEKELEASEQEELTKEQGKLQEKISTFSFNLKTGLDTLLGRSADMDADEIAAEVENRLREEAAQDLNAEADSITTLAVDGLEESIDKEGEGATKDELLLDIGDYEEKTKPKLVEDIDNAEADIEDTLDKRAEDIKVEVLEERLTEKLGHEVDLELEENGHIKGLDEALAEVKAQEGAGDDDGN
jgi:hypothetical protein